MDENMDGATGDRHDSATWDIVEDVDALRAALAAHGITLPSLGVDPLTLAGWTKHPPLVALGNCTVVTARRLAEALRAGAGG